MTEVRSYKPSATNRIQRAKFNIYGGLLVQAVTIICGLIVPRLLLGAFGSDAYGATASIAQFLSYITLLEGGISGVARAALYKPLADEDWEKVSQIQKEIELFFRLIGGGFIFYTLVIACSFKSISHFTYYDWLSTFILVVVISFSTIAQYFIGISYCILLQATQRGYIDKMIATVGILLNTVCVVVLVYLHCGLITVKLVSAFVFLLQPVAWYWYVKTHFPLVSVKQRDTKVLTQKWHGLGQHLAYFLHNNTDITILTIFTNLSLVAIYAVYNMIVVQIQNLALSFAQGMEPLFGELLAKKEITALHKAFNFYETLLSIVSVTLFSTTALVIVAFIEIYTHGVTDAPYVQPLFAVILICGALVTCLRMPYHNLIIAAGHFKQTQWAAYGEAGLNIVLSILLVWKYGLIGVAFGTLAAVSFRFIYYIFYLARFIFKREIHQTIRRLMVNGLTVVCISLAGYVYIREQTIKSYFTWALFSAVITLMAGSVTFLMNWMFYRKEVKKILKQIRWI